MIKTLKTLFKQDREKFIVPKSVQAVIPLKTMWEDGIFLVGGEGEAFPVQEEFIRKCILPGRIL